jgi:hypothetical protein
MLISRIFIIALFLSLILLLTYVNSIYINNYLLPYLSVSPIMLIINASIIAEYIHLTREILGLTLNLNMNNQNPQPSNIPQPGNTPQPGNNLPPGNNPLPGNNLPPGNNAQPVSIPRDMENIINDGNTLSPLEIMIIKRRI